MVWYYVKTGMNSKDMFGEVAYVELEEGVTEDTVRGRVSDLYPKFNRGQYVKSFKEVDWDVESERFDDEESFLVELGSVVGSGSNNAYSKEFGRVSTKEARRKA